MTKHTIAARRDGERVAIDTLVDDPDFRGVANTSFIGPEAAIRFGEAMAAIGRVILAEKKP